MMVYAVPWKSHNQYGGYLCEGLVVAATCRCHVACRRGWLPEPSPARSGSGNQSYQGLLETLWALEPGAAAVPCATTDQDHLQEGAVLDLGLSARLCTEISSDSAFKVMP